VLKTNSSQITADETIFQETNTRPKMSKTKRNLDLSVNHVKASFHIIRSDCA